MRRMGWSPAPPSRASRASHDERGAALVEFALILPVVTSLLLGTVTGGAAYHRKITMADAVREASRLGATLVPASVTPPDTWLSTVTTRTVELSAGTLTTGQVCVKLVREAGASDTDVLSSSCPASMAASEPAVPANLGTGDCIVKVWAERGDQIQAGFFSKDVTLKAKAVSRYEGAASC